MTQETREETICKTVYVAIDGEEFIDKKACEDYEKTAVPVIKSKVNALTVRTVNMWDFCKGYEDNTAYILKPKTDDDVKTILQWYFLDNPCRAKDTGGNNKLYSVVKKAMKEGHCVIGFSNCDDELYDLVDSQDYLDAIISFTTQETMSESK